MAGYELIPINSEEPIIYQLARDISQIQSAFHEELVRLASTYYPQINSFIHEARNNLSLEFSPSQLMSFIEEKMGGFVSLLSVLAKGLSDSDSKRTNLLVLQAFEGFAMELNVAAEILFRKYGVKLLRKLTASQLGNSIFFVSDDDWPWTGFEECQSYNESSIHFLHHLGLIFYAEEPKPVTITFRDEGFGAGAHFDHYNIQKILERETSIIARPDVNVTSLIGYLDTDKAAPLEYGRKTTLRKRKQPYLAQSMQADDLSLVIIPGYSSTTITKRPAVHKIRSDYEQSLIKYARNCGVPVLAICGGLATMIEAFGGSIRRLNNKKKSLHTSKMPSLNPQGELINVEFPHNIAIQPQSRLSWHMGFGNPIYASLPTAVQKTIVEVTSVHWFAAKQLPDGFFPAAIAAYKNKNQEDVLDETVVEAIEAPETHSGHGASIIATQYHPEVARVGLPGHKNAYAHYGLFKSMLQESDARNKSRVIKKEIACKNMPISEYYTKVLRVPEPDALALEEVRCAHTNFP